MGGFPRTLGPRSQPTPVSRDFCAVVGDVLTTRWFAGDNVGAAVGVAYAVGEVGGAVPFYLGSLLHRYFPDTYAQIIFVGSEWHASLLSPSSCARFRFDFRRGLCRRCFGLSSVCALILSCVLSGFLGAIVSFACMLCAFKLDSNRHSTSVHKAKQREPDRSLKEYASWIWAVVKRQSSMYWLTLTGCGLVYGGFYTFLNFLT